jgi:hypothetical protein
MVVNCILVWPLVLVIGDPLDSVNQGVVIMNVFFCPVNLLHLHI